MITPLAVIADVHALFAFAEGLDNCPVGIDQGLFEELRRLLTPNGKPCLIDGFHQQLDVAPVKATTEVARRGGVGNPFGAQRVQIDFVVTPQFDVLQSLPAGQNVVGDIQHMIRLVIRQMPLQHMHMTVDVLNQSTFLRQQMHTAHPAGCQTAGALPDVVPNVGAGQHGSGTLLPFLGPQPSFDSTLAFGQLLADTRLHLKSLRVFERERSLISLLRNKHRRFLHFSRIPQLTTDRTRLR
jgi:hypothetical protein